MNTNTKIRRSFQSISFWLFLATALLFVGCSASVPSTEDAQRLIQDQINKESQGRIKLVSFQKTNGQQGELLGVKIYNLEYQAEIEFTENCKWVTGRLGEWRGFRTVKPVAKKSEELTWDDWLDNTQNPGKLVKKGSKERVSGSITFEKTEKGWRAVKF